MGINGLTQLLSPIFTKQNVKFMKNKTVGIDAMTWVYRAVYSQKYSLSGIKERLVSFFFRMLKILKKYKIKVILKSQSSYLTVKVFLQKIKQN